MLSVCKRMLAGKRVVLTGASSGIGWHLATKLASHGAHIIVTARRADQGERQDQGQQTEESSRSQHEQRSLLVSRMKWGVGSA